MIKDSVANQYAQALFELATEKNRVNQYLNDLRVINDLLTKKPGLKRIFLTQYIPPIVKKRLFTEHFKDLVCPEVFYFLFLLADRGRTQHIVGVLSCYQIKVIEQQNIRPVELVLAAEPPEGLVEKIRHEMAQASGKTIDITVKQDPKLLGGFKVTYGDRILDFTLRGQLDRIAEKLHETTIAGG